MSLINEALKRTRDNSYQAAPARPMTVDTYRLNSRQDSSIGSRTGVWMSLLVVAIAGAAVLVVALRLARPSQQVQQALGAIETPAAEVAVEPSRSDSMAPPPVAVAAVPAAPVPVIPAPAPPPAPEPPKLALQGVTSGATWREAMINGVNVREGEDVEGARVVSIESRRVTLHFGDREIVLRMP